MFGNRKTIEDILANQSKYEWQLNDSYYDVDKVVPSDNRPVLGQIASEAPSDKLVPCLVMYYDRIWWAINPGLIDFKPKAVRVYRWTEIPK